MESPPSVTFAVPVFNEAHRIIRCLESVRNQDYPQGRVKIIIADGGSTDRTLEIASAFDVEIVDNPERLGEFGLQRAMLHVGTDLVVVFAADNELAGADWISRAVGPFVENPELAALWGPIIASRDDPPVNRYYALIQSEPLTFFVNKNLKGYLESAVEASDDGIGLLFRVDPSRPLPWGANGLVLRSEFVTPVWHVEGYLGDNDAFQTMLAAGHDLVAWLPELKTYHHSIRSLADWREKFERNFSRHFIDHYQSRDMSWAFPRDFKWRFVLWLLYSLLPPISLAHSLYLAARDREIVWLYHPIACFLQSAIYIRIVLTNPDARRVVWDVLRG
jgi:glycosyltransferase involved in cell wall biosynthesis